MDRDRSVAAVANAADVVAVDVEARHPAAIVVTAVVIAVVRGDLAADEAVVVEAVVVEAVAVEAVVVEVVMVEARVVEAGVVEAVSFSRRGRGRHTAGDDECNGGESDNLGFDRHLQSPSDLCAAVVARMLNWTEVFDFGSKVAGAAAALV
jgi:hypothetical protein